VLVVEVDVVDAEAAEPSSPRTLANLVATTTSSRRPAIARPTSSSFVKGPYMSAVSRRVTPSSSARWIVAMDSASSWGP
jgi:hypothetical protein